MALTHPNAQVEFYRCLVQHLRNEEWVDGVTYGPYNTPGAARDAQHRWYHHEYANGTRRKRVQVQDVDCLSGEIVWRDV